MATQLTPQQASIFSTLPQDWQQEILNQINSVGYDAAMQANQQWLQGQDMNDPANAALRAEFIDPPNPPRSVW